MSSDPIDNADGHVMVKRTIAEFVENDEVIANLREIGVDYAQQN